MDKIRYGGAFIGNEEVNAIIKTINKDRRNWQCGEETRKFEEESAKFLGVKYGVVANSGSSAGLLALSAFEFPKGSEIVISAVTFPTIFNIILQCGLVPVVVDADPFTNNIDISKIEKAITPKTKAIIAIHILGNPCDMPAIMKIAKKHKLKVLEDNCDGFGSSLEIGTDYDIGGSFPITKKIGSFGDISITSFHAAHIVSMGVGGGVYTDDKKLMENVRMFRDWGRQSNTDKPHKLKSLPKDYNPRFIYEKIGYNFQILELQAAMGRVQLKKINKIKSLRKKNFDYLCTGIDHIWEGLVMPRWIEGADVCWFGLPLSYKNRGKLVAHLEKNGIETRSMFSGDITKHPAYTNSKYRISGKLTGADYILKNSFFIGVHPSMTKKQLDHVIKTFNDFFA